MGCESVREYDAEFVKRLYRRMYLVRCFEERVQEIFLSEKVPGTVHSSLGQEAVAAGVCEALHERDYLMTSHRGHGYFLARGTPPRGVMAELYGKAAGVCGGMGGSLHLSDFERRIPAAVGVVGAQIPMVAGIALASRLRGRDEVAVAVFGDGATNQGYFHEGINLAATWRLPAVFVCENNLYAVSLRIDKATLIGNLAEKACAYGIPGITVDGNDAILVHEAVVKAVQRARGGEGPSLIECKTYRHKGHSRFEPARYRPQKEFEDWVAKDPVRRMRESVVSQGLFPEAEVTAWESEIRAGVDDAQAFARRSPDPAPSDALKFVFAKEY